jgi:ribosomal protein L31E
MWYSFYDKKDYIIDIRNLKFYLEKGLALKKINRVVEYKQRKWLKEYIDLNTCLSTKAKNDFEKDYFKLMNNSVFGKTMENVRGRIQVECCLNDERQEHLNLKQHSKVLLHITMETIHFHW